MHNLRHFYYQNKEKIWKVVLIIAFLLGIIYFLNGQSVEKSNQNSYTSNNNVNYSDEQNKTYISDKSPMSGGTVTEKEVQKINNTVSKFLQYCKNGKVEEAYNMLSGDCKEEYNTLEKFKEKYLKTRFDKNSIYEIEKWIKDTYKITISKDLLSTGDINSNEKQTEYITIVEENSEEKLNINSYIGKTEMNKEETQKDIKISVISKEVYLDHEIYELKIENLSNKTIKLDSLENIGTMYLKDSSGNKYNAYTNEILEQNIEIKSKQEINISIKYAKNYSNRNTSEGLVFENIILDYIKYKTSKDKEKFEEICEVTIEL